MRNKTYLAPCEQWDRTVELYLRAGQYARFAASALGDQVFIGQIVRTHRLFLPGDCVLVEITHGAGRRRVVYAVSGKGYIIRRMFLKYEADRWRWGPNPKPKKGIKSKRKLSALPQPVSTSGSRARFVTSHDSGPLRFVEHPESLEGSFPDSPAVRRFVVENLAREECRTPGKRE
jgi:hypothetical protein